MLRLSIFSLISLVISSSCSPLEQKSSSSIIFEKRELPLPVGWQREDLVDASFVLPLKIGLKQQNLDKLEEELLAVSHPDSPKYGKHWEPQEVADYFSPNIESISAVQDWLHANGIAKYRHKLSIGRTWLHANVTVSEVETLLNTQYYWYNHSSGAKHIGKCTDFQVNHYLF